MKLTIFIKEQTPSSISHALGRRIQTSTRDKKRLLNKCEDIDRIIKKLGYKIVIEEI